jgi:DNA topoisomerase I
MAKPLVIVESPAKAKTIGKFLGDDKFTVMASVGHVVDLPSSGLCVDVEKDFELTYEVTKKDVVRDLKTALAQASELFLATDEDREGEAIAWHLLEQLKPKVPVKRMVFHEITKSAIAHAVDNWREVDQGLVDAQEARRTLDRLYGYEVSPVLWRKVKSGLSAGRVQSPSIRLIVQRERERMKFRSTSYWDLAAKHATTPAFESALFTVDGARVAQGKDFDDQGKLKEGSTVKVLDEPFARGLVERLAGLSFTVRSVEERPSRSSPKPPFMTSTLQQEGGRKLNMSAQQVMRVAQGLYERGYITYMRTDSTNLSATAIAASRAQIESLFGAKYLPAEARSYAKKSKNAQEAHEAIRPAGEAFRTTEELSGELSSAELKLYDLIWKRTIACQMADSEGLQMSVKLFAKTAQEEVEFSASGRTITFPGFLRAYVEGSDDPEAELEDRETALPRLKEGDVVPVAELNALGHTTSPPARYTEASLVKKLEELGIGRPSTYASIMGNLQAKYVWKKGSALIPSWTAFAVVNLMEKHFGALVDFAFTARMEDELDDIASGAQKKLPYLKRFYFGDKKEKVAGLHEQVVENIENIDAAEVNSIPIGKDPASGTDIVVKPGKYGPYVKRGEDTASVPDALAPDEMTVERAVALLNAPKGDTPIGADPVTGLNVYAKSGRFGPYVQLGEMPDAKDKKAEKPRTASLFKSMKLEGMTLETALELLKIPRTVGVKDGKEITAHNGKFGPYLKWGDETRNLGVENEPKLLTITVDEAMEVLSKPREFRGRGTPKPPLKTFGPDPVSGKEIVLKEGRFGYYVTDGITNGSLRKGDLPEDINVERAQELLVLRREYELSEEGAAKKALREKKLAAKTGKKPPKAPKAPAAAKPAAAAGAAEPKAPVKSAAKKPAAKGAVTAKLKTAAKDSKKAPPKRDAPAAKKAAPVKKKK